MIDALGILKEYLFQIVFDVFFVLHTATRVLKDWECQVVSPRLGLDIGIYIHSTLLVSIPVLKPLQFQWFLLSLHPFVCLPTSTHHAPSIPSSPAGKL